ncbi:MAG: cobalt ECF transporter T component CbiQ [Synergistes sp.]|nr:cobalt ECF transporter T component CbiQ [Synergistes sp.]
MPNLNSAIAGIYTTESLSRGASVIHRLNALAKMIATLFYIVAVVSFPTGTVADLLPFFLYPAVMSVLAGIPFCTIFKRSLAPLPFCIFAGLSSLFFERTVLFYVCGIAVTRGFMIFVSIVMRTFLCASAALILIAVTPFHKITQALSDMNVPRLFVMLFEMIYRFIALLTKEAISMSRAYTLRSGGGHIKIADMGAFIGQLMLRVYDRSERVCYAMKCRGFGADIKKTEKALRLCTNDYIFIIIVCGASILFRKAVCSTLFWRLL